MALLSISADFFSIWLKKTPRFLSAPALNLLQYHTSCCHWKISQHIHERTIVENASHILYYYEDTFEYFHRGFWPHCENCCLISVLSLATGPLHILLPLIRTLLFSSTNSSFFLSLRFICLRKPSLIAFKKSCSVTLGFYNTGYFLCKIICHSSTYVCMIMFLSLLED